MRRNQVYFGPSNVSTDRTYIIKDQTLNEKFKISIKQNLTKSQAKRLKSAKYKTHVIKEHLSR